MRAGSRGTVTTLALVLLAACAGPNRLSEGVLSTCPPASTLCGVRPGGPPEATLFLVGDAGYREFADNPVLQDLRDRIVATTERGIAVTAVFLGDNVYDVGVRDGHPEDARLLAAQVETVRGTTAEAIFIPGNHDWANHSDSLVMVQRQWALLEGFRLDSLPSANVRLLPEPGCPGPAEAAVTNMAGTRVATVLAVDSQWWLTQPDTPTTCASRSVDQATSALRGALQSAPRGPVVLAVHHPLKTGGPHGGLHGLAGRLLYRSGLSGQEVNSGPYRSYVGDIRSTIEASEGTVFLAAGHDHTLQVHRRQIGDRTWHQIVSGSASKLSTVGALESNGTETLLAAAMRGYVRLDIHRGGATEVTVLAGCRSYETASAEGVADACEPGAEMRPIWRSTIPAG